MIGQIRRTATVKEKKKTPCEKKLEDLRATLQRWEDCGYGFKPPATCEARLALGNEISRAKGTLVETGLYRVAVGDHRDGNRIYSRT